MRTMSIASVAATLFLMSAVHVQADEARDLLDKSMNAMGGEAKLAKLATSIMKSKGKITNDNVEVSFTDEWYVRGGDNVRVDMDAVLNGQNLKLSFGFRPDKGWVKAANAAKAEDIPKEYVAAIHAGIQAASAPYRLATFKDKNVELSPLGELKMGGRDTVGLRVIRKGQPDLAIFFDKTTSLPVKAEIRMSEGQGQELGYEFFFDDYKDFDGVKVFSKLTFKRDNKVFLETEVTEVKPQESLDDSLFNKP